MDSELYISADEAARLLGVTMDTLYAYVSRKRVRSFPAPGTRKRRYWRADIEALRRTDQPARTVEHTLARTTELTLLTDAGLFYRGRDATMLAETETLESVAALLWGVSADVFAMPIDSAPAHLPALFDLFGELSPLDRALSILPAIEHENPRSADLSPLGFARTSASLVRWIAAIVAGRYTASEEPVHIVIARSVVADDRFDDLVRRTLVLAADHELDPITYVVRAAGNVGCTPYGAAMAGLSGTRGQRMRHQRTLATERFIREILNSSDPAKEVARLYRLGEPIPGFTPLEVHRLHDPRAQALLMAMRDQLGDDPSFAKLDRAIAAAADLTACAPHFILPVAFLGQQLGYNQEPLAFSAPGRMAGWLAQAYEQYQEGTLIRPRAAYIGILPS